MDYGGIVGSSSKVVIPESKQTVMEGFIGTVSISNPVGTAGGQREVSE